MNEPWLIGQTQFEGGKGNFQLGQFNQEQRPQGMNGGFEQGNQQNSGQQGTNFKDKLMVRMETVSSKGNGALEEMETCRRDFVDKGWVKVRLCQSSAEFMKVELAIQM